MLNNRLEINKLVIRCLEGEIGSEELDCLNQALAADPEARRIYAETVFVNSQISRPGNVGTYLLGAEHTSLNSGFDNALWRELAESEKAAPQIQIAEEKTQPQLIQKVVYPPRDKRIVSKLNIFLLLNAAAILFFMLFLRFSSTGQGTEVATLADSFNAKWVDAPGEMTNGTPIVTGNTSLLLREGYAEFQFYNQARVTVEGPAEFQIITEDQIKLNYGRLYAAVPREAIGFTIKTPSSQVIDLGTEFGVRADFTGDTLLHVVKGKTVLIAGEKSNKQTVEVTEGAAKRVSAHNLTVSDAAYNDHLFVRKIDSANSLVWRGQDVDLADIVGGGNGFGTGKLDSGIETNTGRRFETPDADLVRSKIAGIMSGGGSYNLVDSLPFIDGVFVADGRTGPVQITSAGHTFDGFFDGGDVFWGNIFNGAWHASDKVAKHQLKLNGQMYGIPGHPAISLHSSQGITFDLQAIRESIPGGRVLRFTSLFGVSETVALEPLFDPHSDLNLGKVNCRVLIDGNEKFQRNAVSYQQGALEISIDISDEDRFLTLVVTESQDRRAYDWALFAKPSLVIDLDGN